MFRIFRRPVAIRPRRSEKALWAWLLLTLMLSRPELLGANDNVRLIGAELPPYAYHDGDRVTGLGVEILQEAARRLGQSEDVQLMPFKRAFQNVLTRDNLLMTPVARVSRREGMLNWAIYYTDDSFFYVSRAGAPGLTHELARKAGTIGVLAGSAPLAQLKEGGVSNYLEQTRDSVNISMLRVGRIDAWFTSAILLSAAFKNSPELDPAEFVVGEVQSRHCVYIIASNDTPESVLRPWQGAVDTMRADGTLARILDSYLDPQLQRLIGVDSGPGEHCRYR